MRLTLRTLLAYLDDVLEPADKEALGKKIESSEFAEDLVHRTKDTMRRLRLSAPQVVGTGMGLDPNSVAEYLDNVMPPENVGDFERICLESDMHLAEVASCHHVLTMVLGQPADIDPAAKQRMYVLPAEVAERKRLRVEQAHTSVAGQPIAAPVAVGVALAAPAAAPAREVEIPEYLRASGWSKIGGPLLAVAALLLVGATLYFSGAVERWMGSTPQVVAQAPPAEANLAPPSLTAPLPADPAAAPAGPELLGEGAMPPVEGAPEEVRAPETIGVGDDPARKAVVSDGAPGALIPETTPPPETVPAAAIAQETPALSAPPENVAAPVATIPEAPVPATTNVPETDAMPANTPELPPTVAVDPDGTVHVGEVAPATGVGEVATEPVTAIEPPVVVELGTYRGGKNVLLRHDDTSGAWLRMAPRSAVVNGERLLALPEFRPMVTLASGVHLELAGGTLVSLSATGEGTATEPATIEIVYGRIVLINTSGEERAVHLVLGTTSAEARLAQNATLAVELERKYVPGNDPRTAPAPVIARMYVPDGGVVWQDANGTTAVDKASEWTIADSVPTALVSSTAPPSWIDAEAAAQTSEQRYGAPVIEGGLSADRPVDVQLLEMFQSNTRQKEVRSLIARSGMHVGLYSPFIEALRDSAQRPNWDAQIDSLRAAMAMSPESAAAIRKAIVEQRGEAAAADLYEMLCGYSADQIGRTPDQVKTGAIARLIDWLDQDSLDYRVLAKHDLWEITGKQLMPNPAGKPSERQINIRKWRSRLEAGELLPAVEQ